MRTVVTLLVMFDALLCLFLFLIVQETRRLRRYTDQDLRGIGLLGERITNLEALAGIASVADRDMPHPLQSGIRYSG